MAIIKQYIKLSDFKTNHSDLVKELDLTDTTITRAITDASMRMNVLSVGAISKALTNGEIDLNDTDSETTYVIKNQTELLTAFFIINGQLPDEGSLSESLGGHSYSITSNYNTNKEVLEANIIDALQMINLIGTAESFTSNVAYDDTMTNVAGTDPSIINGGGDDMNLTIKGFIARMTDKEWFKGKNGIVIKLQTDGSPSSGLTIELEKDFSPLLTAGQNITLTPQDDGTVEIKAQADFTPAEKEQIKQELLTLVANNGGFQLAITNEGNTPQIIKDQLGKKANFKDLIDDTTSEQVIQGFKDTEYKVEVATNVFRTITGVSATTFTATDYETTHSSGDIVKNLTWTKISSGGGASWKEVPIDTQFTDDKRGNIVRINGKVSGFIGYNGVVFGRYANEYWFARHRNYPYYTISEDARTINITGAGTSKDITKLEIFEIKEANNA